MRALLDSMAPIDCSPSSSQYDRSASAPTAMQTSTRPEATAFAASMIASWPLAEAPPTVWAKPRTENAVVHSPHRSVSRKDMP